MEVLKMLEQWSKWEPTYGLSKKYYIDAIIDDIRGFKIKLTSRDYEDHKVTINFPESVWMYRSTEEGLRLLTLEQLAQQYGASFYTDWSFFKIKDSQYLNWIYQESYQTITNNKPLIHFCLVAMNDILDVVADYEPKITIKQST